MTTLRSEPVGAFIDSAAILARGGNLDAQSNALATQVSAVSGASATVIYLLDGDARLLLPVGWQGLDADEMEDAELGADESDDPAGVAVRERRTVQVQPGTPGAAAVERLLPGAASGTWIPLVTRDESANDEVQGLVLTIHGSPEDASEASHAPDGSQDPGVASVAATVNALADLAAVAIRQARLERALIERSDWYDRMSHLDPLTGLANRLTFERALEHEIARAARQSTDLSVAVFRVDQLEDAAEGQGSAAADELRRQVAASLAGTVRVLDTVGRLGPDEFGLVAPGTAGGTVISRIREAVGALEPQVGHSITLSSGTARYPEQGATTDELLSAAHRALAGGVASESEVASTGAEGAERPG